MAKKTLPDDNDKKAKGKDKSGRPGAFRETIESIAIAFVLALLFRAYEAEAFVIPTGSMATTLMGRHKDEKCPKCGYWYQVGTSIEVNADSQERTPSSVVQAICPMCRFRKPTGNPDPKAQDPAGSSYNGDRIIVLKSYNVSSPKRWDVFVFRYPRQASQNYIKRLAGMPNEVLRIYGGDLYVRPHNVEDSQFQIARKPPEKILAVARDVADNDYIVDEMTERGWPPRWQDCPVPLEEAIARGWPTDPRIWPWKPAGPDGWVTADGYRSFKTTGAREGETWLRFQQFVPTDQTWDQIERKLPLAPPAPVFIQDHISYNDGAVEEGFNPPFDRVDVARDGVRSVRGYYRMELPWVGDLVLECRLTPQGRGAAVLELIKGGRRFHCRLDFASGDASLSIDGGKTPFIDEAGQAAKPVVTAKGVVPPTEAFDVRLANVDSQLLLWIDDDLVALDGPTTYVPGEPKRELNDYSPVGIASFGAPLSVEHLRVKRDIYYHTMVRYPFDAPHGTIDKVTVGAHGAPDGALTIYARDHRLVPGDFVEIKGVQGVAGANGTFAVDAAEDDWFTLKDATGAGNYAGGGTWKQILDYVLFEDQFFALGDNSQESQDSRMWDKGHQFVHRDMILGKAFWIFWPHSWNEPIPFTPNVGRMGFVR
ncbi:MAG: hypothetical protein HYS13_19435 [Planctomycetia bacterium]|nr:hypothetical protein [Planctomycetia bacterium]